MAITKVSPGLLDLDSGITISVADNSDNLTIVSTDADATTGPNVNFYRNSSSPADNDHLGEIRFTGRNDNSQDVVYSNIETRIKDASDGTEDGYFDFETMLNGTLQSRLLMNEVATIVNEDSLDLDFRVETNANAHGLYVDSTADRVSIGGDGSVTRGNPKLLVELGNFNYVEIKGAADSTANGLLFSDGGSGTAYGVVGYNHASDFLNFYSASTQRLRVDADGVKFGTDSAAANALDDYEEGSVDWLTLTDGTATWTQNQSGNRYASYTKIGNQVHVHGNIYNGTLSGSQGGPLRIPLPFNAANVSAGQSRAVGIAAVFDGSSAYTGDYTLLKLEAGGSYGTVVSGGNNGAWGTVTFPQGGTIIIDITYTAA